MRIVIYAVAVFFFFQALWPLWALVGMADKGVYGVRMLVGVAVQAVIPTALGIALLFLARRVQPISATPQASRVVGIVLLVLGLLASAVSIAGMMPYFTGQSCSMALIGAPVLLIGLAFCAVGIVALVKASRHPTSKP